MASQSLVRPTKASRTLSHLLLAGCNPLSPPLAYTSGTSARQSPSNPSITPVPLSNWLGSVGRADDVAHGWRLLPGGLAAGLAHALLAYKSAGSDRVFAVGRNEAGQLGIGFASQEETRGMVEGFGGDAVLQAAASSQSSYLLLRKQDSSALYSFGNLSRGRLGQPAFYPPRELEPHEEPILHLLSQATEVRLPPELSRAKALTTGFEHLLVLSESGEIWGTGCNTDGQLGLGEGVLEDVYQLTQMQLPKEVVSEGGAAQVRAGADTSALITASGKVWTWGNSEYAQALHGRKIDQIHVPTPIDDSFLPSSRRIVDYRCGGSFALVLDDKGSVYSAGYGALGLGPKTLESQIVRRLDTLEDRGITRIRAGWGWATAVRDDGNRSSIFSWGLNNQHGRLGVGALARSSLPSPNASGAPPPPQVPMHVYEPTELVLPLKELGIEGREWELGEVECGQDALWAELTEFDPEEED
ncbi:regulator of chromosome condensation 1/beta-lactamase-inhibitor protein II [Leucosporidium creatinivorum]|uniref:Regulator of chromosome condensation 1/beta-lactamase-inhibitor protein II n=1 Tax=Leucosporidium creatinivorum TaxID=106004 RepID=A0A1Y2F5X5_9BASI|nr:regulator of chromosome condensation 1/beta-lactamase-inhibitor protein II [Leucosporidium creatinivorum]